MRCPSECRRRSGRDLLGVHVLRLSTPVELCLVCDQHSNLLQRCLLPPWALQQYGLHLGAHALHGVEGGVQKRWLQQVERPVDEGLGLQHGDQLAAAKLVISWDMKAPGESYGCLVSGSMWVMCCTFCLSSVGLRWMPSLTRSLNASMVAMRPRCGV